MKRKSISAVFSVVLVVAAGAQAKPPESFGVNGASFVIGDDENALEAPPPAPTPLGIVWGATSEGYRECDFARVGNPQCLRKVTIPSNTRFYGGYYVGGGTPTPGVGRCSEDGTWGWDYSGILFPKQIALNWTAKGRSQGGTGAYKTDGPKLRRE